MLSQNLEIIALINISCIINIVTRIRRLCKEGSSCQVNMLVLKTMSASFENSCAPETRFLMKKKFFEEKKKGDLNGAF